MNQIQIYMPPPSNWQDFQMLIGDVAKVKFKEHSVQEYGRQGQRQNGVDVYAVDIWDKSIGIQCKETKINGLTDKSIDKEIDKALAFRPKLDLFIIATTLRIDARLQDHVNSLNSSGHLPFRVLLMFWDDVNQEINRSSAIRANAYQVFQEQFGQSDIKNHLAALKKAFERPAFQDNFLHERNYDDFENALVLMKAFLKTGFLYDNWSRNLVLQTVPSSMIGDESYQKFVCSLESKLERIYQSYLSDKRKQSGNPSQLYEKAGDYNIKRRSLLDFLNKKLGSFGEDEIPIYY
ncbi:hypothetical protein ACM25P_16880 [Vreelandella alkaliphila]|uniref:hypothetical protein n=1 Tax=Vreelandella alkaliphila TaxID=272774 RepID=UPI0039F4C4FA